MHISEFSEESYLCIVQEFINRGYIFSRFNGSIPEKNVLIIRHDIDLDLNSAERMAEIEHQNNISTSYFVSMRSPFYNPFSAANYKKIMRIHELGHEVGVHINAKLENGDPLNDIKILNSIFPFINTNIATVHHPGDMNTLKNMVNIPAISATYSQILNNTVTYVSDSTGAWRYGHPLDTHAMKEGKSIILLTHPIWWIEKGENAQIKFMNFLSKDLRKLDYAENFLPSFYQDNFK